jgi:putative ABC transport system permease protein
MLNIVGLAIGLAVCVIIALFVYNELGYDRQFANADRIYRLDQVTVMQGAQGGRNGALAGVSSAKLAPMVKQGFEGVSHVGRYIPFANPMRLQQGDNVVQESGMRYADSEFLQIFGFRWLAGDAATALERPDSLVLTIEVAKKLFGTTDVLGETVKVDSNRELQVTGVIDKLGNSHLNFTALLPISLFDQQLSKTGMDPAQWGMLFGTTYAELAPQAHIADIDKQLDELAKRESAAIPAMNGRAPPTLQFISDPLPGIYLAQTYQGGSASLTNLQRVELFGAIGLCVLLIAVVNFMNLATAGATRRALEVGVKVAHGASRLQLIRQFLGESLLMVSAALVLAVALAELLLPAVNARMGLQLALADVPVTTLLLTLAASALSLSLLAGAYPAFYLTAWQPAKVLRGLLHRGRGGLWFRNVLVVAQFSISIALIVAAMVMQAQLRYNETFDTGFNATDVQIIGLPANQSQSQVETLLNQLRVVPGVEGATQSLSSPRLEARLGTQVRTADTSKKDENLTMMSSSPDYLTFYRIRLLAGRYPGSEGHSDAVRAVPVEGNSQPNGGVVLNASAARLLGWTPQEALGQTLKMPWQGGMLYTSVIGVVVDTVDSTRATPVPMAYIEMENFSFGMMRGVVSVRLAPAAGAVALQQIRQVTSSLFPGDVVPVSSLHDTIAAQYEPDRTQMHIFAVSALLAVAIACFGLFGLATFNTERRTKEIGVRKVMGGSVWSIVLLLTNDFSRLVLAANLIAWPLAWYAMNRWLQNFTYRIDLTPLVFIGSGLIALSIAWVTVGGTAAKAASQKPVLALRYE